MRLRMLAFTICLMSSMFTWASATTLNVPGSFASVGAAYAAAVDGDEILITDSGTYSEALLLNKSVNIRAASGQTPTIRPDGTQNYLFRTSTSTTVTFKVGSSSGGRIILSSFNPTLGSPYPLSRIVTMDAPAGTQTFENLYVNLTAAAVGALQLVRGNLSLGASTGTTIFREIEINANSLVHTLFRPELLAGRTLTLDWVRVSNLAPGTGGWLLYNGGGSRAYGTINMNKCLFPTPHEGREGLLADGSSAGGIGITWNITNSIIRRTDDPPALNFQTWRFRNPLDKFNASYSAFINAWDARAFDLIITPTDSRFTLDHCDVIAENLAFSIEGITNTTITLTNSNLITNRGGSSNSVYIGSSTNINPVYLGGNNNKVNIGVGGSESSSAAWTATTNDIAINPGYIDLANLNLDYTNTTVGTSGTGGTAIGSRLNVASTLPLELTSFMTE